MKNTQTEWVYTWKTRVYPGGLTTASFIRKPRKSDKEQSTVKRIDLTHLWPAARQRR